MTVTRNLSFVLPGHLNISGSRIKNVNVTYESGFINGSNVHVSTLSADQYNSLFPSDQETRSRNFDGNPASTIPGVEPSDDPAVTSGSADTGNTEPDDTGWSDDCSKDSTLSKDQVVNMIRKKRFVDSNGVFDHLEVASPEGQQKTRERRSRGSSRILTISEVIRAMIDFASTGADDRILEQAKSETFRHVLMKRFSDDDDDDDNGNPAASPLPPPPRSGASDPTADEDITATSGTSDHLSQTVFSYSFKNNEELTSLLPYTSTMSKRSTKDNSDEMEGSWLIVPFHGGHSEQNDSSAHGRGKNTSAAPILIIKLNDTVSKPSARNSSVDEDPHVAFVKPEPIPDTSKVILETKGQLENGGTVHIQFKEPGPEENAIISDQNEFGRFIKTPYETFMEYHLETENITTSIYVSEPVNPQEERIILAAKCLKSVLKQDMVMKITFVLLPPQDPESHEDGARSVVQKIYNLIIENQFSLKLNGNTVDVVDADDTRKTEVDEREFCPRGVEIMVFDEEFQLLTIDNVTMMYVNSTNSYFGVGRFDVYFMVSGSNNDNGTKVLNMIRYAFVCVMPRIAEKDCTRIDLPEHEYSVLGDNKSIVFEGKTYDVFSYTVTNETTGSVQICVPSSFHNKKQQVAPRVVSTDDACGHEFDNAVRAEGYITQVLGRLSIFALACVLVTYCIFPKLRNLPGVNTMNLTFALFVAEIIFIEGMTVDIPWLCSSVAISVHYTFLAAHFWMNVMSFDVYRTVAKGTLLRQVREKSKYLPRYALYAWGVPLLIVAFCMFIDFSALFDFRIGYGPVLIGSNDGLDNLTVYNYTDAIPEPEESPEENREVDDDNGTASNDTTYYYTFEDIYGQSAGCWIRNPLASLIAFGAPILLIFLTNCMFFIRTIISISRTAKLTKQNLSQRHSNTSLQKMTGRTDVMLYVRMSTVMGFTWFFGLSSAIMSSFLSKPYSRTACIISHVQSVLFNVFNISQGVFIFVAFVCNRRVMALYAGLFLRVKKFILRKSPKSKLFSLSSSLSSSQSTGISYIQSATQ